MFALFSVQLKLLCTSQLCVVFTQALQVQLRLQASFLNNSASRWEALADPWAARLEGIDHGSPVYRSDHQR